MPAPHNPLKAALAAGEMQYGLWLNAGDPVVTEIAGRVGFDWGLIDGEHGPYDPRAMLDQLRALELGGTHPVVRVPFGKDWIIKQVLDIGAQSLLVPMVNTAHEARAMVAATRYAPEGIRGQGAMAARAGQYGEFDDYAQTANDQICLIVQAETRTAIQNLDEIAAVDGVDAVFIGPADLSADMGYLGQPDAPEVRATIAEAITRIRAAGKAAGIIHGDPASMAEFAALGVTFLGIGGDVGLMREAFVGALETARDATGR